MRDCGAPYERVVEGGESTWEERKAAGATWGNVENPQANGGTQRVVHGEGVSRDLTPSPGRTVGFAPSCDCDAEAVPGTVLDPFAGAGTTSLVATRLKRSSIGIELNESYAQMARDRIKTDIRLGHRSPKRARPQSPDQASLLDVLGVDDAGQIPGQLGIDDVLESA